MTPAEAAADDPTRALSALDEVARLTPDGCRLAAAVQAIAELARRTLAPVDDVSVTMVEDGQPSTVAATGELATTLGAHEQRAGRGPGADAALSGLTIVVDHRDPATAYPDYSEVAARHGVTHTVSVGTTRHDRVLVGLTLHTSTGGVLDSSLTEMAETFAGYLAFVIGDAAPHGRGDLHQRMLLAVGSRAVIEQAKGIVMAETNTSADAALEVLVMASQQQNRSLLDVAHAMVASSARA